MTKTISRTCLMLAKAKEMYITQKMIVNLEHAYLEKKTVQKMTINNLKCYS